MVEFSKSAQRRDRMSRRAGGADPFSPVPSQNSCRKIVRVILWSFMQCCVRQKHQTLTMRHLENIKMLCHPENTECQIFGHLHRRRVWHDVGRIRWVLLAHPGCRMDRGNTASWQMWCLQLWTPAKCRHKERELSCTDHSVISET